MKAQTLHTLIIDPDSERNARLRGALVSTQDFVHIHRAERLSDGLELFASGHHIDLVFIANRLPELEIAAFIEAASAESIAQGSRFLVVLDPSRQDGITVANHMISGADGFLLEPYCVESIKKIIAIARHTKMRCERQKYEYATTLMLTTLMAHIDLRARSIAEGNALSEVSHDLRTACVLFRKLSGSKIEHYYEVLHEKFSKARPRKRSTFARTRDIRERTQGRAKRQMQERVAAVLRSNSGNGRRRAH